MSGNIEFEMCYSQDRKRACVKSTTGEFILSRMTINGPEDNPDSITLTGVGRTRDGNKARMWIVLGILEDMYL